MFGGKLGECFRFLQQLLNDLSFESRSVNFFHTVSLPYLVDFSVQFRLFRIFREKAIKLHVYNRLQSHLLDSIHATCGRASLWGPVYDLAVLIGTLDSTVKAALAISTLSRETEHFIDTALPEARRYAERVSRLAGIIA